jgi:hypothetical protein
MPPGRASGTHQKHPLKNDVSDSDDGSIVQARPVADFSAQIASAAGIDNAIETKSFNDRAKADSD